MPERGMPGLRSSEQVLLQFDDENATPDRRRTFSCRGFSAEFVSMRGRRQFEFKWAGADHYLALHDLKKIDGETALDGMKPVRLLDVRDRMTFIPQGCGITGWSDLARRQNSFVALYFDPSIIPQELDDGRASFPQTPLLYFESARLRTTLEKIQTMLANPTVIDGVYFEALGVLAAIELDRVQAGDAASRTREVGGLSVKQQRIVTEFIEDHLGRNISLEPLANLAKLSRFHFIRAFKKSTGLTPHQYILQRRIERAKTALLNSDSSMYAISVSLGFGNQGHFSAAFRKITGLSPLQFRRHHK